VRWLRATLYPQKLALNSPTYGVRSVGIVRLRTEATEFSFSLVAPTWSLGNARNFMFHFSFFVLDSRYDPLGEGSARRKAAKQVQ
jgi:hypothetical protein